MIWILCSLNKEYDLQHFQDAAFTLDISLKIVDVTKLQIYNEANIQFFYKGSEIQPPDYCLNWNGCMNGKLEEQLEASLAACGTVICNSLVEINHWQDKFRFQVETKMNVPNSMKLHSSMLLASIGLIETKFKYPVVLKSDTGSLGMGVYKANSRQNLEQIMEVIELLDKSFKVHVEQYIDYAHDLRMYIIGDNYYLMERVATDDFRANIAKDAKPIRYMKTTQTDELFSLIRSEYESLVIGVDILLTDDQYYICEINSAPSFKGMEQVHNVDIASEILKTIIK